MTQHNTNKACCSIPPVQSNYQPKGKEVQIGGLTTYSIGPDDAEKNVIFIYDIFGFWPTTKQGADLISAALPDVRVLMPDFFRGKPFPIEHFPPDTPEKQQELQSFFGAQGDFAKGKANVDAVIADLKKAGGKRFITVGFCWGAKLSIQLAQEGTQLAAVAGVHPAMIDPADAEKATVPIAYYPSKDEPKDKAEAFGKIVNSKPAADKSDFKIYPDNHHGWAAARADLSDASNKEAFHDVYQRLANFFHKNL